MFLTKAESQIRFPRLKVTLNFNVEPEKYREIIDPSDPETIFGSKIIKW